MLIVFGILIVIASIILGFIVLVQNPKGGGLTGALGGFSNQLIGVKQSTDIMEKGTWIFAAIVGVLCLVSPAFIPAEGKKTGTDVIDEINTKGTQSRSAQPATTPADTVTMPNTQPVTTP